MEIVAGGCAAERRPRRTSCPERSFGEGLCRHGQETPWMGKSVANLEDVCAPGFYEESEVGK